MCFVSRALNVFPLCFLLNYLTPRCDPRGPHFPGPLSPPAALFSATPQPSPRPPSVQAAQRGAPCAVNAASEPPAHPASSLARRRPDLSQQHDDDLVRSLPAPPLPLPHTHTRLQGLHVSDCRLHRAQSQKRGAESARRGPTLRRFSGLRGAIAFALSLTVYGASPCAPAPARPRSDAPAHARLQGKTAAPSSRAW